MKKVTIPTCANPFVVIVNGMKYTYPAGETVEVPDDVAAVIEQHDEAHNNPKPEPVVPPFTPSTGESGGGGLPVVELSTTPTAEGVSLNADEIALVNTIGRNAFVMVFAGLGYYASCVMTPAWVDGVDVYCYTGVWAAFGSKSTANFMLERSEDMQSWSFYIFQ